MIKSAFPFRVLAYLDLDLPSRDTFLLFPPPINFVARGDRSSRDPRSSQLCPRAPTTRSAWSEKGSLFRISFIRKAVFREMEIIRILTEYSRRRISTNRSPRFTSEKNYQLDDQWNVLKKPFHANGTTRSVVRLEHPFEIGTECIVIKEWRFPGNSRFVAWPAP